MPFELYVNNTLINVHHSLNTYEELKNFAGENLDSIYDAIKNDPFTKDLFHDKKLDAYDSKLYSHVSKSFFPTLVQDHYSGSPKIILFLIDRKTWKIIDTNRYSHNLCSAEHVLVVPSFNKTPFFLFPSIQLSYGAYVLKLPHQLKSTTPFKELLAFIYNDKFYPQILNMFQKNRFFRKLYERGALALTTEQKTLENKVNYYLVSSDMENTALSPDQDNLYLMTLTSGLKLKIAPALRNNLEKVVLAPPLPWFNAKIATIHSVCITYLGGAFKELSHNLSRLSVQEFCNFNHKTLSKATLSQISTAIHYYCMDTDQTDLLRQYSVITSNSYLPVDPLQVYGYTLPAINRPDDSSVEALENELKGSPYLSPSVCRTEPNPQIFNFLVDCLYKEKLEKKAQHYAKLIQLVKKLPRSVSYTRYHQMFWTPSRRELKDSLSDISLPHDIMNIITDYLTNNYYLDIFFSVPLTMLVLLNGSYKHKEFDNFNITNSCKILLSELNISTTIAQGIMVGPDTVNGTWSLDEQLKKHKNLRGKYIYFALPTKTGDSSTGHATTVVIDTSKQTIYCIDSEDNLHSALDQALKQLEGVVAGTGKYANFNVLHPPQGKLKQQSDPYLCGAYVVSNVIGLITWLEDINLSPELFGIEPSKLIKDSQLTPNTWEQPKIQIIYWKLLIVLTSLTMQEIENLFIEQTVENQKEGLRIFEMGI